MENISMNQALSIWDDLWLAYSGKHPFGGDTAEIYAYRLMPYSPLATLGIGDLSAKEFANACHARKSLATLLWKFEVEHDCGIEVDGLDISIWHTTAEFSHRCHVKVINKEKTNVK
jgi:hypothetical protein